MVNSACCKMSFAPFRRQIGCLLGLLLALLGPDAFSAGTNFFQSVADTSLLEVAPSNNHGGFFGMNAGTTQNFKRTRAIFRFDLSSLPTNTVVQSAVVELAVTRQPDEPSPSITFGLHRMLRPWGEGDKNPAPHLTRVRQRPPGQSGRSHLEFCFFPHQCLEHSRRGQRRGFFRHGKFVQGSLRG